MKGKVKRHWSAFTLVGVIILLGLSMAGCGNGNSGREKEPETVSIPSTSGLVTDAKETSIEKKGTDTVQDTDVSVSSGYYLSLGVLDENVVWNGPERDEAEATIADKKVVLPQGEIRSVSIGSWSRKDAAYNPEKSEIISYLDALERAEMVDDIPDSIFKKMVRIETHIVCLNSHGQFRTMEVTDFGNGYHQISWQKDDAEDFSRDIPMKSDTGKKYRQVFLRSTEAEKITKGWIQWESAGEKGFDAIQSARLSSVENEDWVTLTEGQLGKLKKYLKADKKVCVDPCGNQYHFECIQEDGSGFHFSISADGECISTDKNVYEVEYPDSMRMAEWLKRR